MAADEQQHDKPTADASPTDASPDRPAGPTPSAATPLPQIERRQAMPAAPEIESPDDDDEEYSAKIEGSTDHPLFRPVVNAIKQVYDPEIPVNILELGLIYRIDIDGENNVNVQMTLTSPACPSAQELPLQVRGGISVIPDVKDADVEVVFDPPWGPDKMSDVARVTLGMM